MNTILIVDSNKKYRDSLIKRMKLINSAINIIVSNSVSNSLEIAHDNDISAFFIDIHLKEDNGLNLAYQLRNISKYKFIPIVFITAIPTREIEAFRNIHCFDYLIKPVCEKHLFLVLNQILIDYVDFLNNHKLNHICLNHKSVQHIIQFNEIIYIEIKLRKIVIVTPSQEIIYKSISLKNFMKQLPSNFIRVHQSIIINKEHLKKLDLKNGNLELNGISLQLPIGVSFKRKISSQL